ncbi:MAG: hypothetical protein KAH32_01255 [Chlamydiia bacterium]|nr:hypothetical protein [Chlamydiia bacterium]
MSPTFSSLDLKKHAVIDSLRSTTLSKITIKKAFFILVALFTVALLKIMIKTIRNKQKLKAFSKLFPLNKTITKTVGSGETYVLSKEQSIRFHKHSERSYAHVRSESDNNSPQFNTVEGENTPSNLFIFLRHKDYKDNQTTKKINASSFLSMAGNDVCKKIIMAYRKDTITDVPIKMSWTNGGDFLLVTIMIPEDPKATDIKYEKFFKSYRCRTPSEINLLPHNFNKLCDM